MTPEQLIRKTILEKCDQLKLNNVTVIEGRIESAITNFQAKRFTNISSLIDGEVSLIKSLSKKARR